MSAHGVKKVNTGDFGYLGNPRVKRDGIEQDFTQEEINEYAKCMTDPAYFARNYIKIINLDKGLVDFDLWPYQEKMFDQWNKNRFNIVLACRQSGKSISSVVYILWYAIFNPDQSVAILANKGSTARSLLGRITLALENLPFFLQPGCKSLNKGSIEFSNNSRIISASTSSSSIRGESINLLFLDEFAFIDNDAEFYTSTYPVVSSGKSTKIIITSTANGVGNVYHKLWEGANAKTNAFVPLRVDWIDVPGRDEAWKAETIANTSELQFGQEYGNSFHGKGNTLIDSSALLKQMPGELLSIKEHVYIYDVPVDGHSYIMTVDVGKGRGQDYSTWTIFDVSQQPFKQVCVFHDNMISPMIYPDMIYKYATAYNDAYIIVENNDVGAIVCNGLYYDLEYENMFLESSVKAGGIGVTMSAKVKRIGCSTIKDLIEEDKVLVVHGETIKEMTTFITKANSYEASGTNNDDLMMNLVMFGWFASSDMFQTLTDISIKDLIYNQKLQEMQDDMLPFGYINNGLSDSDADFSGRDDEGDLWTKF